MKRKMYFSRQWMLLAYGETKLQINRKKFKIAERRQNKKIHLNFIKTLRHYQKSR